MKHKRFFFFTILGWTVLLSCSPTGSKNAGSDSGWYLEIVDSLCVDYVGTLSLHDYDKDRDIYLMEDFQKSLIFLVGRGGEVLTRFSLNTDGPNAISSPLSFGMYDGKITIMDSQKGFLVFSDTGAITNRVEIPAAYFYVNMLRTPIFELGDDLAYIRPERGEVDYGSRLEMFRKSYSSPLLEVLNPASKIVRKTMPFPPETIYQDGNFYHWTFPHIVKNGREWLLQLLGELKYHVYHQVGDEVLFQHTVDLDIKDAVPILGVPFEKMDDLYELWKHIYFGKIENLFVLDENILVQYT